jgi:2-keto-3-deoxy-L-rhamnonate aldolase RhmA
MAQALESNSTALLNGSFAGTAQDWLNSAVATQQHNGLTSRYLNQTHKVDAAFYSPEGDVIELHDTAGYDLQILDGTKTVHSEHLVLRYVVLMTPGADHWVVRQLQSVPQF